MNYCTLCTRYTTNKIPTTTMLTASIVDNSAEGL